MSTQHIDLPSDFEIMQMCRDIPPFAGASYGNRLVKISEKVVVKFGIGVRMQEAMNQTYARQHVDSATLYVPHVFRFFEVRHPEFTVGYLIMEYIAGRSLQDLEISTDIVRRTIKAIQHLALIPIPTSQGPGPVGGAPAQGYLWSDDGAGCTFKNVDEMENWMNIRLDVIKQPHISLRQHNLGMCHMDLVRRNIFLLSDPSICFVDWAFAGFFPPIFEIYTFRELRFRDELWFDQLLEYSPKPSDDDEQILGRLGMPAFVSTRYAMNGPDLPS